MAFERYALSFTNNTFGDLYGSVTFEDFSKGRQLAVLHRTTEDKLIPLVRTTTIYQKPSQPFSAIHNIVVDEIRKESGIHDLDLNNAMLEVYDSRYKTMKFHTDQALDLAPDSYICLFSCYENGGDEYPRILTVSSKETGQEHEVQLLHHSAVVFSTKSNRQHLHKIEGRNIPKGHNNKWIGFTLRLSKTFVDFSTNVPKLISSKMELGELRMATEEETKAFFGYKGAENRAIDYDYPGVCYTISPSDRIVRS